MKNQIKIVMFLLFVSATLFSCTGGRSKRDANFLPPLKIQVTDEIKGYAELVDLVKSSEKAINEFSDNIEQLVVDSKDILKKEDDEQTLMDKIKVGKLMVQFVSNSTQLATTIEKFDTYVNNKKEQEVLNDAQLKALEQVGKAFETRMDEIDKKYKDYFEK
ncbi:MAG: hypothetical protein J7L95_02770 [Prolixibacteraceae bacterium]|nr:hypothetical protein [Prolixibacteraceae bacterium]